MKFINSIVIALVCIVLLLPACSAEKSGTTNTPASTTPSQEVNIEKPSEQETETTSSPSEYTDPAIIINESIGKTFIITVRSNPSTGYIWTPGFDQGMLTMERRYTPDEPQMLGSGGAESFEFKGLKKGSTEIRLKYERPFSDSPIQETRIFKVTIL